MKHDLTTWTWQDDTGCPISIVLAATSDAYSGESAAGIENLRVRGRLLAAAAMVTPKRAHGYSWSNKDYEI